MYVYAVRHGESETNANKQWTGWLDAALTEKGKEDAKKANDFLKEVSFDKIYASDLRRAMETAEIALPKKDYETTPLLREIDVGTLAGQPLNCLTDEQRTGISRHGYAAFDGETKEQFNARISEIINSLEKLNCETVAMFTHAGFVRGMLDKIVGLKLPRKNICCNNCMVAIFEYIDETWRLHSWINFL